LRGAPRRAGHAIVYIHRTNREGYKAGALENGLKTAKGEFVAIFDADFLPEPDFLRPHDSVLCESGGRRENRHGADALDVSQQRLLLAHECGTILLDGHFVVEHWRALTPRHFLPISTAPQEYGAAKAIDEAGGWEHDTLTEDTDLSYRSQLKGWKFLYLPEIECASELPVDMNGFKAQQARWAKGLMQTAKKILPRVLKSDAPWHVKAEAFFHLTANISYPLMVLLSTMLLPVMIVRFQQGWFQNAADRLAFIPCFHVLDLQLLSRGTKRASPQDLAAHIFLSAFCHGHRHRHFRAQRSSGPGSHR